MTVIAFSAASAAYGAAAKITPTGGQAPALGNIAGGADSASGGSFGDLMGQALGSARDSQYKAESLSLGAVGNKTQIHDLVTAVSDAELTLQTVVAIRDKMINAYQDILKMPI